MVLDQADGGGAQGEAAVTAGLGRSEDTLGQATLDAQHPAVEVSMLEDGQLTASGTRVGSKSYEQQPLLGAEQQASP